MTSELTFLEQNLPHVIELRRRLHQIPELGFEEYETCRVVREELGRLGIAAQAVADVPTATVAWIGDTSKPCIAFRADIDALPIEEGTQLPYRSRHAGRMHACGHDGHTATLLGVAGILKAMEKELPVCAKLIWQPAEEGGGGGERLVQAGLLDGRVGPKVDAAFALHGWPALAVGSVSTRPGAVLAATDNFKVTFRGKGCHGAYPHLGRDPIAAACEAVVSLQQVTSRETDPTEPAVVTVGMIQGGTAVNIIPDTATFSGTARTLSRAARQGVAAAIERRCAGIAAACGCEMEFAWFEGYPPLINDPGATEIVARAARAALGEEAFVPAARPSMGGEDFSYYLDAVPGCFFMVGVRPHGREEWPSLHSDQYDFSDEALATGMRVFTELALHWDRHANR